MKRHPPLPALFLRALFLLPLFLLSLFLVAPPSMSAFAQEGAAENWHHWRGPQGNGVSPKGNPPLTWSETENVRFRVRIPGRGLASPVIWGDRIFLLTTVPADTEAYAASQKAAAEKLEKEEWPPSVEPVAQRFVIMALSRRDGGILWWRTAAEKVPHETHYIDSSWASASPITDGRRVFAHFGSNGLYAYTVDGDLLWQVDLGDMTTRAGFGEGSSPALFGETLVINWDHEGDSFLVALDAGTGKLLWKKERPDEITSWATPLIVEHAGRKQVVVAATGRSRGYDLETGEEIWHLGGLTTNVIPTPVYRDGVVYLTSGYRGNMLQAVDLAKARGDLAESEAVVWTHDRHTPYVPSPLLYGDELYFLKHFRNIFSCLDAESGTVHYTEKRLPGISNVYASPIAAAGRVYVFSREGNAVVLKAGKEFEVLAENDLGEGIDASPAVVGDEIFVRGREHLYCLSRNVAGSQEPAAAAGSMH